MSEILSFKATECRSRLSVARSNVVEEIHKLDHSADNSFTCVNNMFDVIIASVEDQREKYMNLVKNKKDEKKKNLENQLDTIENKINEINSEQKSDHLNDIRWEKCDINILFIKHILQNSNQEDQQSLWTTWDHKSAERA